MLFRRGTKKHVKTIETKNIYEKRAWTKTYQQKYRNYDVLLLTPLWGWPISLALDPRWSHMEDVWVWGQRRRHYESTLGVLELHVSELASDLLAQQQTLSTGHEKKTNFYIEIFWYEKERVCI